MPLFIKMIFMLAFREIGAQVLEKLINDTNTYLVSDLKMNGQEQEMIIQSLERNPNVCTLCEQYASQALTYLAENKTQTEIIDTLHTSCSQLRTFKQEVVSYFLY